MAGIESDPLPVYSQLDPPEVRGLSPFARQQLNERLIPEARLLVQAAQKLVDGMNQCMIDVRARGVRIEGTFCKLPVDLTIKVGNL